jgi:hypothetical protein
MGANFTVPDMAGVLAEVHDGRRLKRTDTLFVLGLAHVGNMRTLETIARSMPWSVQNSTRKEVRRNENPGTETVNLVKRREGVLREY